MVVVVVVMMGQVVLMVDVRAWLLDEDAAVGEEAEVVEVIMMKAQSDMENDKSVMRRMMAREGNGAVLGVVAEEASIAAAGDEEIELNFTRRDWFDIDSSNQPIVKQKSIIIIIKSPPPQTSTTTPHA